MINKIANYSLLLIYLVFILISKVLICEFKLYIKFINN